MPHYYRASKVRSNRPGFSVSFRHPLRNDSQGRPGLKVRRGLNTADEVLADTLVAQLNEILSDESWWSSNKRHEAAVGFPEPVVSAFYDSIQSGVENPESIRQSLIPLPAREKGYAKVLLVGTTGAGKTSLLRQLIGSDPNEDRFPSTAPAKTTIADIEVILSDGEFESVVTFFSEFQIQASIEECVSDACLAISDGSPISKVVERFLNHRDQKFRLSYILGNWDYNQSHQDDDGELSFDDGPESQIDISEDGLSAVDRSRNFDNLQRYVERMKLLTASVKEQIVSDLGTDIDDPQNPDREAARELFQETFDAQLFKAEIFHDLVGDILDDVRARFDEIASGDLIRRSNGWPEVWTFRSNDRREFLRTIRWFSSNYWPQFGRLLTPLVQGIRVKGPLFPDFGRPRLVLLDGQGLGHTPDSSSSLTTHLTRKFPDVDVVLLVDNAKQPLQAAALSVLRTIASYGYHDKLAIAFTHFDQIKGDNLGNLESKRAHVMASVFNAVSHLSDTIGAPLARTIGESLERRCFMLPAIDRSLKSLRPGAADYIRAQLAGLVELFEETVQLPEPTEAHPIYDPTNLSFAVQEAVSKFKEPWSARLGLGAYEGVRKEHWTRVKALNRRIAGELDDEYDSLRPVADLVARLTESVSRFLDNPIAWSGIPVDEKESQGSISRIRQIVSTRLHDLATRRLILEELAHWRESIYGEEFKGAGSTHRRAVAIRDIYGAAAPFPDAVMTSESKSFLSDITRITTDAIVESGGSVELARSVH